MKRVLRILSNVAAVVSLLACVAISVLWVRSYWVFDGYMSDTTELRGDHGLRRYRYCVSNRGLMIASWRDRRLGTMGFAEDLNRNPRFEHASMPAQSNVGVFGAQTTGWNELGFGYVQFNDAEASLIIPYWAVAVLLGLVSGSLIVRWHQQRRRYGNVRYPSNDKVRAL